MQTRRSAFTNYRKLVSIKITYSKYRAPGPLLKLLNWLLLPKRVKYRQSQLVFKIMNGLAPEYVCFIQIGVEHFDQNNTAKCQTRLICPMNTDQ